MYWSRRCTLLSMSVFAGVLVSACSAPTVSTQMLIPAAHPEATRVRDIAVLEFTGKGGKEYSEAFEAALRGIVVNEKPYFNLIDRQKLDSVTKELALGQTGLINESTASKVGQMSGAKGIYTGSYNAEARDTRGSETRSKCIDKDCKKSRDYQVACTTRTVSVSANPKLIEVETGRVLYAMTLTGSAASQHCTDESAGLDTVDSLVQQARAQSLAQVPSDVAPHLQTFHIEIMDSTDGIVSDEAKEKFKSGLKFAGDSTSLMSKMGKENVARLDRACELWSQAFEKEKNSAALTYDNGLCREIDGDIDGSLALYQSADKLLLKPDQIIAHALDRVKEKKKNMEKLKSQM